MIPRLLSPPRVRCRTVERRAFLELIQMANRLVDPIAIAHQLAVVAHYLSRCQAVAIRLKHGPGYPYAVSLGFPKRYLSPRDDLCARDEEGRLLRDGHRRPVAACLCGQLLFGHVDSADPLIARRRSYILSTREERLVSPCDLNLPGHTLNPHHLAGYETVGLFPIAMNQQCYGLIQCNDRRAGRLTGEAIALMEGLSASAANLLEIAMP